MTACEWDREVHVDKLIRILAEVKGEPDLGAQIGPDTDMINELGLGGFLTAAERGGDLS